jgi:hypothetical protein
VWVIDGVWEWTEVVGWDVESYWSTNGWNAVVRTTFNGNIIKTLRREG